MSAVLLPPIVPVNVAGIPASMMDAPRWAPWRAVWNEKKKKYEKAPHRADRPGAGLSNKSTRGWTTFHEALRAYQENLAGKQSFDRDDKPVHFGGVGYLVTGPSIPGKPANVFAPGELAGVDLDHCRNPATGAIDEWAAEVIDKLDSYTEVSPSGTGLRVMVRATVETDIINHERGIEIYGGTQARFVTITGVHYEGSPRVVRQDPAGVMAALALKYRKQRTKAEVEDLHVPALLSAMDLPDLSELELPPHAVNFLCEGPEPGVDRSNAMFATAVAMSLAGCTREQILTILEANEHAMEVALDHRRQDYDKAMRYLWKDHCQAGTARAKQIMDDLNGEFNDERTLDEIAAAAEEDEPTLEQLLGDPPEVSASGEPQGVASADEFEALGDDAEVVGRDLAPVKPRRFAPQTPEQFMQRPAPKWLIKGVLPQASLAVVYGASGSGKSFFTFDMCAAIVRGEPWRGARVVQGRGVYVVAEGAGGFRNRLEAYCEQHGVAPAELGMGLIANAPNLMDKLQVNELIVDLKAFGDISFIVMDTYARVMVGGNENDAKDVGMVLAQCAKIHRQTGAMVILVHHSGKDDGAGARGSSALRAAADVEIQVKGDSKARGAKVTKQKDGEDGKQYGFRLHTVVLGEDEDGEDITSCVVEHLANGESMDTSIELKGDIEKAAYDMITAHFDLGAISVRVEDLVSQVAESLGYDPAVDKKDRRKERVKRALKSLEKKKLIVNNTFEITVPPANSQNKAG